MTRTTDEYIEKNIKNAIDEMTPDILDDLMGELDSAAVPELPENPMPKRRKRRVWYSSIAVCAATLLIAVGLFNMLHTGDEVCAFVNLDVNPSVELSINDDNTVVSVSALNEDGEKILDGMDLKGTEIKVACNALIGSMVKNGYLSDLSNSVLVSVRSDNDAKGHEIEKMIAGDLNDSLSGADISGAVLGQYVESDQELVEFADANNISQGKAWLIKNLLNTNSKHMTEDALLQLSTQELILLSQERNVETDDSYGETNTSQYITKEDATAIGLNHAGITSDQIQTLEVEFDCEDGVIVYEVVFTSNGQEYEYDINAETGEIIDFESEADDDDDDDDDD